jgi:4-amino-4-deoxy-L-arabinose transferase-like glycosyltransferase
MRGDWRAFRPAIWLVILGVALALLINPPYIGAVFIGAGVGVYLKVARRRRVAPAGAPRSRSRRR